MEESKKFVAKWNNYINGLKALSINLVSDIDKKELESTIKSLKRLAKVAALENYDIGVKDDVDLYVKAYEFV